MARLGELLVAAGVLEADKVEHALRAQVVWGGRLGTNLIELGYIDLDELSRGLGRQHGVPPAFARHFDKADPELQALLPAELADRYTCVPLLHLAEGQIAIAGMDPLDDEALAEIAVALGVAVGDVVMSIAAEQRMRYQLERVYGIARNARFLRSRGTTIPPFPQFGDFDSEPDSEVEIPIDVEEFEADFEVDFDSAEQVPVAESPDQIAFPRADTAALAAAIESAAAAADGPDEIAGRERRTYVKTLGEGETPPKAVPERKRDPTRPKKLGRIAIRKVAVSPTGEVSGAIPIVAASEISDATETLADAAKQIRRSPDRDRVATLVIDAIDRFAPDAVAAMLLVIRGGSATGWKYFCRSRPGADQPELAVPLDAPGLFPRVTERTSTVRAPAGALGPLDARLLQVLDPAGQELAVVPIAIAGKVMCLLAVATTTDGGLGPVETIATSAGTAFARLMRDAGR